MGARSKVDKFIQALTDNGDMFFTEGDLYVDYKRIQGILVNQGYWSGTRVRYYFDGEFNLIKTEERW